MNEEILLTQKGYDKIVAEHDYLVSVRRNEVAEHLKEAKSYGDLSENAEYDAAKNEQVEVEERIQKLEAMIRNAHVVSEEELSGDHINLGLGAKIKDLKTGEEFILRIVGISDADPIAEPPRISNESQVGKALLGKAAGDKVEVETEMGILSYQVLEIIR